MEINAAGELVFPEQSIVCGTTASPLPPALGMSITTPTQGQEVSVANGAQNVPFSATLTNYTAPYDQCPNVTLTPPVGSASNIALNVQHTAPTHTATATMAIPANAVTGLYRASLNCSRNIDGQQIVVAPPYVDFNVVGGGVINNCDPPPAIMQLNIKNYTDPYPNGFGKPWGVLIAGSTTFVAGNRGAVTAPPSPPEVLHIRAWRFEAPLDAKTGTINLPPGMSGLTSISECPGVYSVASTCRKNGSNTFMKWSTKPSEAGACILEPGHTYYLNGAHFNLSNFLSTGVYNNICGCANPPCAGCNLVYQPNNAQ